MISEGTSRSNAIKKENNVLADDELVVAIGLLREGGYGCLYIRREYPRRFRLLNHA